MREIAGAAVWCALTGGVHLRKVLVSGGLTVCLNRFSKLENFITMDQAAVCHWFKLSDGCYLRVDSFCLTYLNLKL